MSAHACTAAQWPELLILSDEGPHTGSAGALLLFRLLERWPADRLHVIARTLPQQTKLDCAYRALATPWRRLEQSRFNRWHRSLRAFSLLPHVPLRRVDELLDGFEPRVVLCVMQHAAYYDCAMRYARRRRLPLVLLVHDVNEQFESVLPFAVAAARRRDGAVYRYAARRLCVSPEMEALCAGRYGARGHVLYPNRSSGIQPRALSANLATKHHGTLVIGFVGNLNYGYGDELLRLVPIFRRAGARVVIYSQPPGASCAALADAGDCVDLRGYAPADDAWRAIQAECDAVLLSYPNPAGRMETLYRYHFPSKMPEYLALGMPVVITGPEYATGVKWGLRNPDAAVTCTAPDGSDFERALRRLQDDAPWRVSLAAGALRAGDRDFDPQRIEREFLEHVRAAAGRSSDEGA